MKSPIKLRWILLVTVAVLTFNSVNNALKRSDYNHCIVTSTMTKAECSTVTNYNPSK